VLSKIPDLDFIPNLSKTGSGAKQGWEYLGMEDDPISLFPASKGLDPCLKWPDLRNCTESGICSEIHDARDTKQGLAANGTSSKQLPDGLRAFSVAVGQAIFRESAGCKGLNFT
jgi:hypothetical protein